MENNFAILTSSGERAKIAGQRDGRAKTHDITACIWSRKGLAWSSYYLTLSTLIIPLREYFRASPLPYFFASASSVVLLVLSRPVNKSDTGLASPSSSASRLRATNLYHSLILTHDQVRFVF